MIEVLKEGKFNRRITPSDWRYSATMVGIESFFEFCDIQGEKIDYNLTSDYLDYNFEDVDLNNSDEIVYHKFLDFIQERYSENLQHCILEHILQKDELTENDIKVAKEKLKQNTICKKIFKECKDPEKDKDIILKKIEENRYELIAETYNKAKSMYVQFIHDGCFRKSQKEMKGISRLDGFYVDLGKKKKSLGFNFEFKNSIFNDESEFEFIPFAFSNTRKAYFINCNVDCKLLCRTNEKLREKIDEEALNRNIPETTVLKAVSDYLKYDVEVITKQTDNPYESLMLRKHAVDLLQNLSETECKAIERRIKDGDEYIDVSEKVAEAVTENIRLDDFIIQTIKAMNYNYIVSQLIKINIRIYGGDKNMEKNTYFAMKKAEEVVQVFVKRNTKNKISSYRQKLISALNFKDYEKFNTILLQLSSYSGVSFDFAYDLFDDFDNNKNAAFAFVNALSEKKKLDKEEKEN